MGINFEKRTVIHVRKNKTNGAITIEHDTKLPDLQQHEKFLHLLQKDLADKNQHNMVKNSNFVLTENIINDYKVMKKYNKNQQYQRNIIPKMYDESSSNFFYTQNNITKSELPKSSIGNFDTVLPKNIDPCQKELFQTIVQYSLKFYHWNDRTLFHVASLMHFISCSDNEKNTGITLKEYIMHNQDKILEDSQKTIQCSPTDVRKIQQFYYQIIIKSNHNIGDDKMMDMLESFTYTEWQNILSLFADSTLYNPHISFYEDGTTAFSFIKAIIDKNYVKDFCYTFKNMNENIYEKMMTMGQEAFAHSDQNSKKDHTYTDERSKNIETFYMKYLIYLAYNSSTGMPLQPSNILYNYKYIQYLLHKSKDLNAYELFTLLFLYDNRKFIMSKQQNLFLDSYKSNKNNQLFYQIITQYDKDLKKFTQFLMNFAFHSEEVRPTINQWKNIVKSFSVNELENIPIQFLISTSSPNQKMSSTLTEKRDYVDDVIRKTIKNVIFA